MLGFLTVILTKVLLWLSEVLPDSPFQDLTLSSTLGLGLGWLNWFVPVGQFLEIMAVWRIALWASVVIRWSLDALSDLTKAASMG